MLNQVVLVGRIKDLTRNNLVLTMTKSYKNMYGEYGKFDVNIEVSESISKQVSECCKINDMVGVRGCIGEENSIIADKVTFLSSKSVK